ncbi:MULTISPECIES: GlxA family transcriptional regulator [Streptomyces]|uniref:GlxA family transcriptional regulator n=1 Tax=Streptomyces TaxID=1883 RepID=UPI0022A97D58|nr:MULTISPECIES: helix-turn-helix domain-containing protein [Streptomyces]UFQ15866.1 helix-turn-helix domain-containing protein [Streptomyces huasconensis]WCL85470.1 helix-turn-helix domain-containing protein [Streptomyces sp. JCM 35825]
MTRSTVAVLIRDGVLPMELGLVHQLLGTARAPSGDLLYDVRTCAPRPGRIRTDADFPIYAEHGLEAVAAADTVIVPASHVYDEELEPGGLSPELVSALSPREGRRVASICTGAFVLAAAGLLDGRRATTHWLSSDRFARTFPAVKVDADVLYVDEGEVLTSAGEAAGIDLCLHLIRSEHGAAVAAEVARRTVVPPHREGGQTQYIRRPLAEPRLASTAGARAWALAHLTEPLTLAELAGVESMSVRTFSRRFREETGLTPMRWLTQRRLDRARELLETTDHTVDRIATETGFGTAASLRQHFAAGVGVSPGVYRATFRGSRT